jgi:hypothetical protein
MKGYVVEIAPEIETAISEVMPGTKWHVWKPFFVQETDTVLSTWKGRVEKYLDSLPVDTDKVSSRRIKADLRGEKVHPSTWKRVIRSVLEKGHSSKDDMEHGPFWRLAGSSLVRVSALTYGFQPEVQAA